MRNIVLSLLVIIIGLGLFKGLKEKEISGLKEIKVLGARPEIEDHLRKLIKSKVGEPFWQINVEQEAANIRKNPWVEAVEVRRQTPDTLILTIQEKKPVAVAVLGDGHFQFVDRRGQFIDRAKNENLADYIQLVGKDIIKNNSLRDQALAILNELPEEGRLSKKDVNEINYKKDQGFQIKLSKSGAAIHVGRENIPLRLDRVRRVVQYLDQNHIDAMHIDADYSKKVLVKLRSSR